MGLRERRYAYRDFITPKQSRKKVCCHYVTYVTAALPLVGDKQSVAVTTLSLFIIILLFIIDIMV